jgi:hypothetical protein
MYEFYGRNLQRFLNNRYFLFWFRKRIVRKAYALTYPVSRYKMLKHGKEKANPERFKYLYSGAKRMAKDGYNSLKYRKVDFQLKPLYTWILVDLPHLKS